MNKYYKTVIQVTVLSENADVSNLDLEEIAEVITIGDCSGQKEVVEVSELTPYECAQALIAQGSDTEFFGLTEDGEDRW